MTKVTKTPYLFCGYLSHLSRSVIVFPLNCGQRRTIREQHGRAVQFPDSYELVILRRDYDKGEPLLSEPDVGVVY